MSATKLKFSDSKEGQFPLRLESKKLAFSLFHKKMLTKLSCLNMTLDRRPDQKINALMIQIAKDLKPVGTELEKINTLPHSDINNQSYDKIEEHFHAAATILEKIDTQLVPLNDFIKEYNPEYNYVERYYCTHCPFLGDTKFMSWAVGAFPTRIWND